MVTPTVCSQDWSRLSGWLALYGKLGGTQVNCCMRAWTGFRFVNLSSGKHQSPAWCLGAQQAVCAHRPGAADSLWRAMRILISFHSPNRCFSVKKSSSKCFWKARFFNFLQRCLEVFMLNCLKKVLNLVLFCSNVGPGKERVM